VFNFRHWESIGYKEYDITKSLSARYGLEEISYEEAVKESVDKEPDSGERYFKVINSTDAALLEVLGLNKHIDNLYIDARCLPRSEDKPYCDSYDAVSFEIGFTDKRNSEYYPGGRFIIASGVERSKYRFANLVGESDRLKLILKPNVNDKYNSANPFKGKIIAVRAVSINKTVPFELNPIRIGIVFVLLSLICLVFIGKRSYILEYKLNRGANQRVLTLLVEIGLILFCSNFVMAGRSIETNDYVSTEYYRLCDSIIYQHRLSQLIEPQNWLSRLTNVYDTYRRQRYMTPNDAGSLLKEGAEYADNTAVSQAYSDGFRWRLSHFGTDNKVTNNYMLDIVYYNGKYYVYYGIAPLIMILPFRLITGLDLSYVIHSFIMMAILCFVCFKLVKELLLRYCKDVSYLYYLLASAIVFLGGGANILIRGDDLYHIVYYYALVFALGGMCCFITCYDEAKERVVPWRIALGGFLMAMTVTARPQVLISVIAIVPLLWELTFKRRALFSRKGAVATLSLILPVAAVACFQMWYNYVRFDSVLEFGANLQLTVNDVLNRKSGFMEFMASAYLMLFSGTQSDIAFPFIKAQDIAYSWRLAVGTHDTGPIQFGGLFSKYIILWALPLIFAVRGKLKENKAMGITVGLIGSGGIIMCMVLLLIGYWQRYVVDFTVLLLLASVIIAHCIAEKWSNTVVALKVKRWVVFFMCVTALSCVLLCFVPLLESYVLNGGNVNMVGVDVTEPNFFYKVYYAIMFMN
jgi:hypothetical protein